MVLPTKRAVLIPPCVKSQTLRKKSRLIQRLYRLVQNPSAAASVVAHVPKQKAVNVHLITRRL